jgi:hypothetical protein
MESLVFRALKTEYSEKNFIITTAVLRILKVHSYVDK